MITNNVIERTFNIRTTQGKSGTGFTIDVDRRQYLVTANHLVDGATSDQLEIFREDQWKSLPCKEVGRGIDNSDIAVFSPAEQLSPVDAVLSTMREIAYGQAVYFLGFPYGQREEYHTKFPLPLAKAGVVSAVGRHPKSGVLCIYLDGHNNPGFSGGPVVYIPQAQPVEKGEIYAVAGVVSSYPTYKEPVFNAAGNSTGHFILNNPGIVIAHGIKHAVKMCKANPIGFELKKAR